MPPTGWKFDNDTYRMNLVSALINMKDVEKSMVVFIRDATICSDTVGLSPENRLLNIEAILALAQIPRLDSFRALASVYHELDGRSSVEYAFGDVLINNWQFRRGHEHLIVLHKQWMDLANREWSELHEKEFAKWLKTIPVKVPPP